MEVTAAFCPECLPHESHDDDCPNRLLRTSGDIQAVLERHGMAVEAGSWVFSDGRISVVAPDINGAQGGVTVFVAVNGRTPQQVASLHAGVVNRAALDAVIGAAHVLWEAQR